MVDLPKNVRLRLAETRLAGRDISGRIDAVTRID
jgi:hypothetical protein